MKLKKPIIFLSIMILLIVSGMTGCGKATSQTSPNTDQQVKNSVQVKHSIPSLNIAESDIPVNSFKAFYFDSTTTTPSLIASENVSVISIKKNDSIYKKINTNNFEGYWVGYLDFNEDTRKQISLQGALGGKLLTLKINDVVVYSDKYSEVIEYSFLKGKNKVEVFYSHTYNLSLFVKFFDKAKELTISEANSELKPILNGTESVWHVNVDNPINKDGSVDVELATSNNDMVLLLSSGYPVRWKIFNKHNTNLKAIIYSSQSSGVEIDLPVGSSATKVMRVKNYEYSHLANKCKSITGIDLSGSLLSKDGVNISLPNDNKSHKIGAYLSIREKEIPINSFKAFYVNSYNPSVAVASENVEAIAYNFKTKDPNGIPIGNFEGYWVGYLDFDQDTKKYITVDKYIAHLKILVDGKVIYKDSKSNVIEHTFLKGRHKVEAHYFNAYTKSELNVAFLDEEVEYPSYDKIEPLSSIVNSFDRVWYLGALESTAIDNSITVTPHPSEDPLVLFLDSHRPIRWKINNPNNVEIKAVVYKSFTPGATVKFVNNTSSKISTFKWALLGMHDLSYMNSVPYWIRSVSNPARLYGSSGVSATSNFFVPYTDLKIQDHEIPINSFKVMYFNSNDPNKIVVSKNVDVIASNFSWVDSNGIQSKDFEARWVGYLDFNQDTRKYISIDQGWSDTKIKIDGNVIYRKGKDSSTIEHFFSKGRHKVEVHHINNWHTSEFNISFLSDYKKYTDTEVKNELSSKINFNDRALYAQVYESTATDNSVKITIKPSNTPVVLFLSSYHAVRWKVDNPNNVEIKAVVYNSHQEGSTVSLGNVSSTLLMRTSSVLYVDSSNLVRSVNSNIASMVPKIGVLYGYTIKYSSSDLTVPFEGFSP